MLFVANFEQAPAKGRVASVNTFTGCLDVLGSTQPVWAMLENVLSIDREVDEDTFPGFIM